MRICKKKKKAVLFCHIRNLENSNFDLGGVGAVKEFLKKHVPSSPSAGSVCTVWCPLVHNYYCSHSLNLLRLAIIIGSGQTLINYPNSVSSAGSHHLAGRLRDFYLILEFRLL